MGRFLVDVPADDVRKLDEIAKREGKSRAAVLREAVSNYLGASGKEGFEWLGKIKEKDPQAVVIMITAFGDVA